MVSLFLKHWFWNFISLVHLANEWFRELSWLFLGIITDQLMNWELELKIICENVCGFATFALALVNNRYVLTSFPRFEIDRFLTTGCCLVIQSDFSQLKLSSNSADWLVRQGASPQCTLLDFLDFGYRYPCKSITFQNLDVSVL